MLSDYLRAVVREAIPPIDSADLLLASMGRLVALVGAVLFPAVNQWAQVVPAWVGALPILFYLFAWAPYRAWSKQADEVGNLTEQLAVGFTLTPSVLIDYRSGWRTVGVTVKTRTNTPVRGCSGHLRLTIGDLSVSGVLLWSPRDGGTAKTDVAAEAFLSVAVFPHAYTGQYLVCFATDRDCWINENQPGRRIAQITVSAANSQSLLETFDLIIDPMGAHAVYYEQGGLEARPLPSIRLVSIGPSSRF